MMSLPWQNVLWHLISVNIRWLNLDMQPRWCLGGVEGCERSEAGSELWPAILREGQTGGCVWAT